LNPKASEIMPEAAHTSSQSPHEGPIDHTNLSVIKNIPLTPIITLEGEAYEIPAEGSLGLLAMGYEGIRLWREKRREEETFNTLQKSD
jgi:hypothetical protein